MSLQHRVVHLDNAVHHGGLRVQLIKLIVMHASESAGSFRASAKWMNEVEDGKKRSYHYGIERDGEIIRTLPIDKIAYHGGDSGWPYPIPATVHNQRPHGGKSVNARSIGICWANRDDGKEELTPEQIASGEWLCHVFLRELSLAPSDVRGHKEVSPGRKKDPVAMDMRHWRALLADNVPAVLDFDA